MRSLFSATFSIILTDLAGRQKGVPMFKRLCGALVGVVCLVAPGNTAHAIVVHTTDFIVDSNRSHFNGFESIPNDGIHFTGGSGPYTEDSIVVQQINGDPGNSIWVRCTGCLGSAFQGNFAWYPDGGDRGYTELSLTGGVDFSDVGFNFGTGDGLPNTIIYELLNNAVVVLTGSLAFSSRTILNYLGFSGGGFDTIRLRDNACSAIGGSVTDGCFQTLTLDNIETQVSAVPLPAALPLFGTGLGIMGFIGWRRKRRMAAEATA